MTAEPKRPDGPLFVVLNLAAGHAEAGPARATIEAACKRAGRTVTVLTVEQPQQLPEQARDAVRQARAAGGVVVASGGDGSLNTVAQATLGSGCAFGVLPRGTFNYFSRAHAIPADLDAALEVLLNEQALPVQVGLVNHKLFLVNASLGLYPKLLEDREAWKKELGRSRFVAFGAGLMTFLRGHRNLNLQIELAGRTHSVRTPTLFVANNALQLRQLGLPEASTIEAGALAAVALRPLDRGAMLGLLLRAALGRLGGADEVVSFGFRELTVRARTGGVRRVKVATDGEVERFAFPLVFRVSPEPLWLIRPPWLTLDRTDLAGAAPDLQAHAE